MTTHQAFSQLISKRGWYKDLGINQDTGNTIAKRFKDGKMLSQDKIDELLLKAGYKIVAEKQWDNHESKIEKLIDMPEEYFGCKEWMDLHAHMFRPDTPYIEKIRAMDIYMQKLKELNAGKSLVDKLLESK